MKLKALIQGLDVIVKGKKDVEIHGLCAHSKKVAPGDLFIALKGDKADGSLFIDEVVKAGAAALLTDLYNPFLGEFTQIICKDVPKIQIELIKRFYKNPSQHLNIIGVTGTNGKTTTSYLIKHFLDKLTKPCGLIGTIETIIGKYRCPSYMTTPDVLSLHKILSEMHRQHCQCCVMEVSSHALAQKRIEEIEVDIAIFTNLSQDHLDYHKTIDNYCQAKQLLFSHLDRYNTKKLKRAIVNLDDPFAARMVQLCKAAKFSYGIENEKADLRANNMKLTKDKTFFNVDYQGKSVAFESPLIGKFNIYNVLAALSVLIALDIDIELLKEPLKNFEQVPGRVQKIPQVDPYNVYVDFAHTEKALENLLVTLKPLTIGKLIVVFGCGGDRDKSKRPLMGLVAHRLADKVIVTSDNPRSEDPDQILQEIVSMLPSKEKCILETDRKKAIEYALSIALPQDSVVIAGKGHEMTQIFKDRTIAFSDVTMVIEAIESKLAVTS